MNHIWGIQPIAYYIGPYYNDKAHTSAILQPSFIYDGNSYTCKKVYPLHNKVGVGVWGMYLIQLVHPHPPTPPQIS